MNATMKNATILEKGDVQVIKFIKFERWDERAGKMVRGIKGSHPAARKVVFLSKSATVRPRHNDNLLCKVVHDTAPGCSNRGVLFVVPVCKGCTANPRPTRGAPQERLRFDVSDQKAANGEPIVLVTVKTLSGSKVVGKKDVEIRSKSDLSSDWPLWVRRQAVDRLAVITGSRAKWLEEASKVREWFNVYPQSSLDTGELLIKVGHQARIFFDDLKDVEVIWVRSRADICNDWPEKTRAEVMNEIDIFEAAFAESKKVEWSVAWSGEAPERFPRVVGREKWSGQITASFVITSRDQLNDEELSPVKNLAQSMLARAEEINAAARAKLERKKLVDGLKREGDGKTRFQWAGEYMTDGRMWFPRVRPEGRQWRKFPIAAVPSGYWETFLSGLEGKVMDELLEYHAQETWRRPVAERVKLTECQEEIKRTLKAEIERSIEEKKKMWQGDGVDAVAVGKCVVFVVSRIGRDLYVVDNPGPGAIYVFSSKEDACKLARDEVTRTALIKSGAARILHTPGWQSRLAEALAFA